MDYLPAEHQHNLYICPKCNFISDSNRTKKCPNCDIKLIKKEGKTKLDFDVDYQ